MARVVFKKLSRGLKNGAKLSQLHSEADQGSILLLVIGLCAVLLLLASTVVAISSAYLERHKLQYLADQAATVAASQVGGIGALSDSEAQIYLSSDQVKASTQNFVLETGAGGEFSNLSIGPDTGVADGNTARVVLSATSHPPLLSVVVPQGITITVVSQARAVTAR